mmetsp:Transcript_23219/g.41877  ORF Transcript_23219/g.41877 Transcript_23219/m.41877 type:complete len:213 (+) Transcript_23219:508-1146(+)
MQGSAPGLQVLVHPRGGNHIPTVLTFERRPVLQCLCNGHILGFRHGFLHLLLGFLVLLVLLQGLCQGVERLWLGRLRALGLGLRSLFRRASLLGGLHRLHYLLEALHRVDFPCQHLLPQLHQLGHGLGVQGRRVEPWHIARHFHSRRHAWKSPFCGVETRRQLPPLTCQSLPKLVLHHLLVRSLLGISLWAQQLPHVWSLDASQCAGSGCPS